MKIKIALLIIGITLAAPVAGRGAGTTAAPFLRQETTARVTSMGGAAAALDDEAGAFYFNPGGLAFASGHLASFSAWNGVDSASRETFISGIYKTNKAGVLSLNYLRNSTGKEDMYDLGGNLSNIELASEYAVGGAWGSMLSNYFSAGAQVKYLHSTLAETYKAGAVTFDVGLMGKSSNKRFSAGLGVQNLVGQLKYIDSSDPLPRIFYGGAAMRFPVGKGQILLTADLQKARDESKPDTHAGLEWAFDHLALRAGMRRVASQNSFTAGGGLKINWFSFDYGFQAAGDLNQSIHKFTLNVMFGKKEKTAEMERKQAEIPAPQPAVQPAAVTPPASPAAQPAVSAPEQGALPAVLPPPAPVLAPAVPQTPSSPAPQQGLPEAPSMPL